MTVQLELEQSVKMGEHVLRLLAQIFVWAETDLKIPRCASVRWSGTRTCYQPLVSSVETCILWTVAGVERKQVSTLSCLNLVKVSSHRRVRWDIGSTAVGAVMISMLSLVS